MIPFLALVPLTLAIASLPARAIPCAPNTTVSSPCLRLIGLTGGVADPTGEWRVTVRDCVPNPLPGVHVSIDLSACSDTHVGSQANQPFPGMIVNGPAKTVTAITDQNGVARFDITGAVTASRVPVVTAACASVFGDGILLTKIRIQAVDQDGVGGVALPDLSLWAADYFASQPPARSDYDCNQIVSLVDLSIWGSYYFSGQSQNSPAAYAW